MSDRTTQEICDDFNQNNGNLLRLQLDYDGKSVKYLIDFGFWPQLPSDFPTQNCIWQLLENDVRTYKNIPYLPDIATQLRIKIRHFHPKITNLDEIKKENGNERKSNFI